MGCDALDRGLACQGSSVHRTWHSHGALFVDGRVPQFSCSSSCSSSCVLPLLMLFASTCSSGWSSSPSCSGLALSSPAARPGCLWWPPGLFVPQFPVGALAVAARPRPRDWPLDVSLLRAVLLPWSARLRHGSGIFLSPLYLLFGGDFMTWPSWGVHLLARGGGVWLGPE